MLACASPNPDKIGSKTRVNSGAEASSPLTVEFCATYGFSNEEVLLSPHWKKSSFISLIIIQVSKK